MPFASLTVTKKLNVPTIAGVPLISRLPVWCVMPVGSDEEANVTLNGPFPSFTVRRPRYGMVTEAVATGQTIDGGGVTETKQEGETADPEAESVTPMVKV